MTLKQWVKSKIHQFCNQT